MLKTMAALALLASFAITPAAVAFGPKDLPVQDTSPGFGPKDLPTQDTAPGFGPKEIRPVDGPGI
jgi:hypothetical protein